ncbi:MAG: hypothetical protein JST04_18360 [Bdellovibrionales bacterium]|nr:hypothetical protein [Bdellovibrionales bacterium]
MSFKRRLRAGLLAAVLALSGSFSGCSLYEGPPPPRKKEFSQGNLGCLKDFGAKLILYFDGEGTPEGVNKVADCAISALRTFGDLVRGENRDRFTAQEVRNFMQRYFLDDVVVSDAFLRELMRVKQALVGGKETDFTPSDLKEAEGLVNAFREILLRLQPVMPLSVDRTRTESIEYVEAEAKAITEVGEIFGRRITEKDSTYSFDELGRLLDEIARAFPATAVTLENIRSNLKVAGVLKEMLISPESPRGTVTAAEWRLVFQDGSRWLGNYLKYLNMQGKFPDWTRGDGRARLAVVIGESIDLFDRVVDRHCPKGSKLPNGRCAVAPGIPFSLVQEVMEAIDWDGTIGDVKFRKSTLENLMVPLVRHFFGGTDLSETGRAANRITADHLDRIRSLVRDWLDGARYVEGLFAKMTRNPAFPDNAQITTESILKTDVREVLRANGGVTESSVAIADGLRGAFRDTYALSDAASRGAIFDGKNKTRPRVYRELVRYTWLRPLMRAAVLGYMESGDLAKRSKYVDSDGLTRPELEMMIKDYWQILVDFQMVGQHNSPEKDSKNRFREAALFTQVSDGNLLISVGEGVQLVLYMLSSDPIGKEMHSRVARICRNGPPDDYGQPTIEPNCYRTNLLDFRPSNPTNKDLLAPFPVLIRFYQGLSEKDRAKFAEYAEIAIRKPGYTEATYFGSDASDSLPMMFHYIEALFLRFDKNGDGFIDKAEAKEAFPVFANTLADIADMKPTDGKLVSVFTYLLAKGSPPVDDSMGGWSRFWHSAAFLWWHLTKPSFKADRLGLLQVFATLSSQPPKATVAPDGKGAPVNP